MNHLKGLLGFLLVAALVSLGSAGPVFSRSEAFKENIFSVGQLKPTDSKLKVKVGGEAPDFTLPSVEQALFVIDKKGIIRSIDVHDINQRPPLEALMGELGKLEK